MGARRETLVAQQALQGTPVAQQALRETLLELRQAQRDQAPQVVARQETRAHPALLATPDPRLQAPPELRILAPPATQGSTTWRGDSQAPFSPATKLNFENRSQTL